MKCYRIKNWNKHYENNRTRELKTMQWVPIPNKLDDNGYTILMENENGAALFGAWIACVEIASRCEPRGTLLQDPDDPHTFASIARISRMPKELIEKMFDVCINKCKWIELIDLQSGATIPQETATIPQDVARKGREGKGKKGKEEKEIIVFPINLINKEFSTIWIKWVVFRKEIKKTLTPSMIELQLKQLSQWEKDFGLNKTIETIKKSIRNGYQGIFEPTNNSSGNNKTNESKPYSYSKRVDDDYKRDKEKNKDEPLTPAGQFQKLADDLANKKKMEL